LYGAKEKNLILFPCICVLVLCLELLEMLHCNVLFNRDVDLKCSPWFKKLKSMRLSTGDKKQKNEKELLTSLTNQQI
jgi:hypothetical protein